MGDWFALEPKGTGGVDDAEGFFSGSLVLGFAGMIGGSVLSLIGFLGGQSNGNPFPPKLLLGLLGLVLFLLGIGYLAISLIIAKSTSYLLTNHRIIETRFGKIVEEIMLADFMGKPINQFLDKHAAGTVNNQPVYNIRITNPRSLNQIEFKSLNESAVEALEKILECARQVVRCKYCATDNSTVNFVCSRCGAPLHC